jgi:hypothetical protein
VGVQGVVEVDVDSDLHIAGVAPESFVLHTQLMGHTASPRGGDSLTVTSHPGTFEALEPRYPENREKERHGRRAHWQVIEHRQDIATQAIEIQNMSASKISDNNEPNCRSN